MLFLFSTWGPVDSAGNNVRTRRLNSASCENKTNFFGSSCLRTNDVSLLRSCKLAVGWSCKLLARRVLAGNQHRPKLMSTTPDSKEEETCEKNKGSSMKMHANAKSFITEYLPRFVIFICCRQIYLNIQIKLTTARLRSDYRIFSGKIFFSPKNSKKSYPSRSKGDRI